MPEDGEHNKRAGYLYWLVDESKTPIEGIADAQVFENFLKKHPGAIDLWIGGHTHTDPEDRVRCFLHTDRFAERGWYDRAERLLPLRHPFDSGPWKLG